MHQLDKYNVSLLERAIYCENPQVVDLLIDHAFYHNRLNEYGIRPLLRAIHCNNLQIIELLLKKGCNPLASNERGDTALGKALISRNKNIIKLILEYTNLNIDLNLILFPVLDRISSKDLEMVRECQEKQLRFTQCLIEEKYVEALDSYPGRKLLTLMNAEQLYLLYCEVFIQNKIEFRQVLDYDNFYTQIRFSINVKLTNIRSLLIKGEDEEARRLISQMSAPELEVVTDFAYKMSGNIDLSDKIRILGQIYLDQELETKVSDFRKDVTLDKLSDVVQKFNLDIECAKTEEEQESRFLDIKVACGELKRIIDTDPRANEFKDLAQGVLSIIPILPMVYSCEEAEDVAKLSVRELKNGPRRW
jgi:hypothetical protein